MDAGLEEVAHRHALPGFPGTISEQDAFALGTAGAGEIETALPVRKCEGRVAPARIGVAEITHAPVGLAHRHAIERQGRAKNGPVLLKTVDPHLYILLTVSKDQLQPDKTIPEQDASVLQPENELGLLKPDLPLEGKHRLSSLEGEGKDQTESDEKRFAHELTAPRATAEPLLVDELT
jgi:hypothetical protein